MGCCSRRKAFLKRLLKVLGACQLMALRDDATCQVRAVRPTLPDPTDRPTLPDPTRPTDRPYPTRPDRPIDRPYPTRPDPTRPASPDLTRRIGQPSVCGGDQWFSVETCAVNVKILQTREENMRVPSEPGMAGLPSHHVPTAIHRA